MGVPRGYRKTITLVACLLRTGMITPMVLDEPFSRERGKSFVAQVLISELRPGDVVIMDNLSSHKHAAV